MPAPRGLDRRPSRANWCRRWIKAAGDAFASRSTSNGSSTHHAHRRVRQQLQPAVSLILFGIYTESLHRTRQAVTFQPSAVRRGDQYGPARRSVSPESELGIYANIDR